MQVREIIGKSMDKCHKSLQREKMHVRQQNKSSIYNLFISVSLQMAPILV